MAMSRSGSAVLPPAIRYQDDAEPTPSRPGVVRQSSVVVPPATPRIVEPARPTSALVPPAIPASTPQVVDPTRSGPTSALVPPAVPAWAPQMIPQQQGPMVPVQIQQMSPYHMTARSPAWQGAPQQLAPPNLKQLIAL